MNQAAAMRREPELQPRWQRGYPIEALRRYSELFAERHRRLCFGAFELTKERDVAAALADNALMSVGDPGGAIHAVAIARRLASSGGLRDFAGRRIEIPARHMKVSAFAARNPASGATLLDELRARHPRRLWVEIFEEDAIAWQTLTLVPDLRYVGTRIAAGSEIKGIYTNAALRSFMPLARAENASVLVLDPHFLAPAALAEIRAELARYTRGAADAWAQHYSSYNVRHSWTAFALRGFDAGDPGFVIKPAEMSKAWKAENPARLAAQPAWTPAAAAFPATLAAIRRLAGRRSIERLRLMRLAAGGELSRHADITNREAGLADGRIARLHIPVITNELVRVHGWDKRGNETVTAFPAGALCYLDQRKPHRVENPSPSAERIHIVVDLESDAALRAMIAAAMPEDA